MDRSPIDGGDDTGSVPNNSDGMTVKLRMLEFFSGIGGMRISVEKALKLLNEGKVSNKENGDGGCGTESQKQPRTAFVLESCRAFDISLHANKVYQHNFCDKNNHYSNQANVSKRIMEKNRDGVCTKLVEQLKPGDVAPFRANLWTMSPPCQPFTTNGEGRGKQRLDALDKRCNGLKGILRLLDGLRPSNQQPRWILLENVKGFADSAMCEMFCECVRRNGYSYRSFLLSPVEFGIPNHRKRFYLLAERDSKRWELPPPTTGNSGGEEGIISESRGEVGDTLDHLASPDESIRASEGNEKASNQARETMTIVHGITSLSAYDAIAKRTVHKVGRYIQEDDYRNQHCSSSPEPQKPSKSVGTFSNNDNIESDNNRRHTDDPYVVPRKILAKVWSKGLGIVAANDTATHCFTAGYGRIYHPSTGSLLLRCGGPADTDRGGQSLQALPLDRSDMTVYEDQLRRFTPEELLRLFGFVEVDDGHDENGDDDDGKDRGHDSKWRRRTLFEIPPHLVPSLEQRYKLIGNSINANVVTELLRELLLGA